MQRALRFLAVLVAALAVLTAVGDWGVTRVIRGWFDKDLRLRTSLAVASARQSLTTHWSTDRRALETSLGDITRDERIMGAAACSSSGGLLAATDAFVSILSCDEALAKLAEANGDVVTVTADLPAGRAQLAATALRASDDTLLGAVLLVHDLRFVDRRESTTRELLLGMFFVLSLAASIITLVAARLAWRGWTTELQRALSGHGAKEFQPLVHDVRSLVDRLVQEGQREARSGPWNAERLRGALMQHLQGERVVVLANREPYIHEKQGDMVRVLHPASGLVTALEPVMRACSGTWVAHGSGTADRQTADAQGHVRVPPGEESYLVRRVWLTEEEERGYYYGFSNEGLWPLCHVAHTRPVFRSSDWQHYVAVNQRFADAVCDEVDRDDPIVLVQDYHFALAPRMIRERLPRASIITFWHIPWPNAERFGICPWREELISGLMGSSILGFHTQQHCNNFIDSVDAFMESRIDRETHAVVQGARRTLVRPYPISIEWPVRWLDDVASVDECRVSVRKELGLPADTLLGVGVDRLDYTKGIEERLLAVDALLTRHPEFIGRFVFVQLAAPSRTKIARYQELNDQVERVAATINAKWGKGDYQPIRLLRTHHEPAQVFRYFRAAELCYVSSLHDGMNLVAKEFVAARTDEAGVLVLSQFTGAARDLTESLVVNPYDLEQSSDALAAALRMPLAEQRERMQSMRRMVSEFNVYRWAGRMLIDAAELRRRERTSGRLSASRMAARLVGASS
ncbi:MAG: trehalose-6-phosphate synthase [Archangium sp.]|nr:trehalose-6-phosphate synthase [Archangium sp.]